MSAQATTRTATVRARPEPAAAPGRLRLVPAPAAPSAGRRGRVAFALLIAGILGAGLVGLLLLNTLSAQDAFRIQAASTRVSQLADTRQALTLQVQADTAPGALAARAARLGMVAAGPPQFVHSHGRLLAVLQAPAQAAPPAAPPAARPAPAHTAKPAPHKSPAPGAKPAHPAAGHPAARSATTPPGKPATTTSRPASPAGHPSGSPVSR